MTGLGVTTLGVVGLGVVGLAMFGLGVVGLGVTGLGVSGLGVTGLCARASPGAEIETRAPMSTSPRLARNILLICVMACPPF